MRTENLCLKVNRISTGTPVAQGPSPRKRQCDMIPVMSLAGSAAQAVLPRSIFRAIEMRRARRTATNWLRREGVIDLGLRVAETFDYTVQSGIFSGMRYTREAVVTRHATPNLLGLYEDHLYPALPEPAKRAEIIIDIGSAEGYFAVGLARLTRKPVYAFDVNKAERTILRGMARANGVEDLLTISSWCSAQTLLKLASRRALIVCDIDGGEFQLFDSATIRALDGQAVIIELHGTSERNASLISQFGGRVISDRGLHEPPASLSFLGKDAARMATEYREPQEWIVRV